MDDDHGGSAPARCLGDERAQPEAGVAEAHLLHHDDLARDVEAVVVGRVALADEHELSLEAARGRGRREVRRDRLEAPSLVEQRQHRRVVPVAERRERTILHLEAEAGEERTDALGRARVALGADEPVAGGDQLLHVRDRPRAADARAQLVFGRREHGGRSYAGPSRRVKPRTALRRG